MRRRVATRRTLSVPNPHQCPTDKIEAGYIPVATWSFQLRVWIITGLMVPDWAILTLTLLYPHLRAQELAGWVLLKQLRARCTRWITITQNAEGVQRTGERLEVVYWQQRPADYVRMDQGAFTHPQLSEQEHSKLRTYVTRGYAQQTGYEACQHDLKEKVMSPSWSPVLPFSKLNKIFFGYFDPENIFLDNLNK